jgi:branched-chain amino acid transport system permease protein
MNSIEFLLVTLGTYAGLNGILVLGLNLQFGSAGILNLAYIAIVAIGAYATGIAQLPPAPKGSVVIQYVGGFGWPFLPSLLFGVAAAGVFTLLVGAVAFLRLRYDYLGLTLFTIESGLLLIATNYYPLVDGNRGLLGMTGPGQDQLSPDGYELVMLIISLASLGLMYIIAARVDGSPMGRVIRAMRDDEDGLASLARNPWRIKVIAFVVGGLMAGLGGGLLATYAGGWSPGAWQPLETLTLLAAIFVGGRGRPLGVLLGSLIVLEAIGQATLFLPNISTRPELVPNLENIASILLLFAFLWWRPKGLVPEKLERFRLGSASAPDGISPQAAVFAADQPQLTGAPER